MWILKIMRLVPKRTERIITIMTLNSSLAFMCVFQQMMTDRQLPLNCRNIFPWDFRENVQS